MTNLELAAKVVQELVDVGVREFILCAGARNSPLVHVLDECQRLKVYSFFEERSAGFFALGRIAYTRRPVAVITTSGTAVAELLPAAIEGTYSSLPLIMVTADRPKQYRGSGAPQAIEQVGIYSYYNEVALDIDAKDAHLSLKSLSWKKPIHINISFDEPLIDGPIPQVEVPEVSERTKLPSLIPMGTLNELEAFLQNHKPVVLVGILPEKAYDTVLQFLKQLKAPVYCEGISSLRGHPDLRDFEIKSGEKMIHKILEQKVCDSVFRIGGIPTTRLWRDLESKYLETPVFSVSFNHFTGLSRDSQHCNNLDLLSQVEFDFPLQDNFKLRLEDDECAQQVRRLLEKYPKSEQGLIYKLSRHVHQQSLYLGNSLPVREWDSSSSHDYLPKRVAGNRGANGIDGQISTFLGWAHKDLTNWCLIGDLTALYDLSALWITKQLEAKDIKIVVINNNGGQIFSRMFKKDVFINHHEFEFSHWAQMFGWNYRKWFDIPVDLESEKLEKHQIIELVPAAEQTQNFWKEYDSLWKG